MSSIVMKSSRIRIDPVFRRRGDAGFSGASRPPEIPARNPIRSQAPRSEVPSRDFRIPARLREGSSVIREHSFFRNKITG